MPYLGVPANDRVQLSLSCHIHQVPAVFGKSVVVILRVLAGDPLIAPYLGKSFKEFILGYAVSGEDLGARRTPFFQECQVHVLHADIFVLEPFGDLFSVQQQLGKPP